MTPAEMKARERDAEWADRVLASADKVEDGYRDAGKRVVKRASGLIVVSDRDDDGPYK